jgi:hypothetical protein
MGIGAAVVQADWLALGSIWVAPAILRLEHEYPETNKLVFNCHIN